MLTDGDAFPPPSRIAASVRIVSLAVPAVARGPPREVVAEHIPGQESQSGAGVAPTPEVPLLFAPTGPAKITGRRGFFHNWQESFFPVRKSKVQTTNI